MTMIEREVRTILSVAARREPAPAQAWRLESLRAPAPAHPLEHDLASRARARGFNAAAAELALPVRVETRRVGGYAYRSYELAPVVALDEQSRLARVRLNAAAVSLGARWAAEQLPEIEEHLAYWRGFHLRGATITAIIRHYDETVRRLERVWRIYHDVGLAAAHAPRALAELHAALFGAAAANEELSQLLAGIDSEPRAMDRELRRLAAEARDIPYVMDALRWCADHEVIEALLGREEGRAFLRDMRALMQARGSHVAPGRLEDPLPLIRGLKQYALAPDAIPADAHDAQVQARQAVEAEVLGRLAALPAHLAERYRALLAAAQDAVRLRDERALWVEGRVLAEVRRVMLELGRRFAEARVLALAGDVFYLELAEVRQAAETMPWVDMHPRVARRRAELERSRTAAPPAVLGAPPAELDEVAAAMLELAAAAA